LHCNLVETFKYIRVPVSWRVPLVDQ